MKKCPKCQIERPFSEWSKNTSRSDGLQIWCKACCKAYDKIRYQDHTPTAWRFRVMAGNQRERERRRQFIWDFLAEHPCTDCGESDPVVLDFDHTKQETKVGAIAAMMNHSAWPKVLEEIAKCEIRCANCHRRRTAKQLGWYKTIVK